MHIDLRQLRHFIALAEQRSFVAGAQAVNLSQSAFSRSIQALERSVGCPLVDRGRKTWRPPNRVRCCWSTPADWSAAPGKWPMRSISSMGWRRVSCISAAAGARLANCARHRTLHRALSQGAGAFSGGRLATPEQRLQDEEFEFYKISSPSVPVACTGLKATTYSDQHLLRNAMTKLIFRNDISINNDLFLDESIEQIITKKENVKTEDKIYWNLWSCINNARWIQLRVPKVEHFHIVR